MAVMRGVFSSISGKVGNMTFSRFGNKQVVKSNAIPHNPRTSAQNINRSNFSILVQNFKILNKMMISPVWSRFRKKNQSAWSSFLSFNLNNLSGSFSISDLILSKGNLESIRNLSSSMNISTNELTIVWDSDIFWNGDPDDWISLVCISTDYFFPYFCIFKEYKRSDGEAVIFHPRFTSISNKSVFAFAHRFDEFTEKCTASSNQSYSLES